MTTDDGKILIHDDVDNDVHIIDYHAVRKTLCGEHLNAISSTYISNAKIPVTCDACLEINRNEGGA